MKFGARLTPSVPPMTPGTKMGICVGVVDIGEQPVTYNGKTNYKNQLLIVIEFPAEKIEIDGEMKPRQLSRAMSRTASDRGTFKQMISSWFATNFTEDDLINFETDELLLRPCMVTVKLSENGQYANIDTIVQYPDGLPLPTTETVPYTFDMDHWDDEVFAKLPEWIQEKIKKSTEYQTDHAPTDEIKVEDAPSGEGAAPF